MASLFNLTPAFTMFDLLKKQDLTDIKFLCEDGEMQAHLIVLASHSKWFRQNFNKSMCVALVEFQRKDLETFLELMYTGEGHCDKPEPLEKLLRIFQIKYRKNNVCNGNSDVSNLKSIEYAFSHMSLYNVLS